MPTIVSGLDPSVRMNAYLAGQKFQTQIQEQQAEEQREAKRQQAEVYKAILAHHKERAKALADINARAQMGDAIALQQQNMEAAAAGKPMTQQRLEGLAEIGKHITDPDARKLFQSEGEAMLGQMEKEDRKKAARDIIDTAVKDKLPGSEDAQARLAAGEEEETIAKEFAETRKQQIKTNVSMGESANALAKVEALIAALPEDSEISLRIRSMAEAFKGSSTAQGTPGAGKRLLKQAQDLIKREEFKEGVENIPSGFSAGISQAFGGAPPAAPSIGPDKSTHATLKGTNRRGQQAPLQAFSGGPVGYSTSFQEPGQKPQGQPDMAAEVQGILSESKDANDFRARLKERGIGLTPDVAKLVAGFRQSNAAPAK